MATRDERRAELEAKHEAELAALDDEDDDFDFDYQEGERGVRMPWSKRERLHELGFTGIPKKPEPKDDDADPKAAKGKPTGTDGKVTAFQRRVR